MATHVANNSGNNEWYTPPEIIEAARIAMGGIDLDPASSEVANRRVKAGTYYTADDDGLTQPWFGRVWLNPPYAQPLMGQFAEAVTKRAIAGEFEQAIVLVNNATETLWFQLMLGQASGLCLYRGRIRFYGPNGDPSGAPLQGQAILYFGERVDGFVAEFSRFGICLKSVSRYQYVPVSEVEAVEDMSGIGADLLD